MSAHRFKMNSFLALIALASGLSPWAAPPLSLAAGPDFVTIVQTLEAKPVKDPKLVYWDQALADELGIKVPPGRVGQTEFEKAIGKKLAFEVKAAKTGLKTSNLRTNYDFSGTPYMFVESDPFGGSGRAAYIPVGNDSWVNIKGVGKTGAGKTKGVISPPEVIFSSHKDGSATLEEAIKEAVMARVADAETKTGSSRVLAIFYTNRMMRYEDGRKVPLALIVRAPLRRLDQDEIKKKSLIADAIAHANSTRLMKGDFVNRANMGAHGEFVDFGCMTHTCGFAPIQSSQNESFLLEGRYYIDEKLLSRKLGENLFLQLGIPEAHIQALGLSTIETADRFLKMGNAFQAVIYSDPSRVLLDFEHVPRDNLVGELKLHEFFRDLAGDFYAQKQTRDVFVKTQFERLIRNTPDVTESSKNALKPFLEQIHDVLEAIRQANRIDKLFPNYAKQVREVAHFKNREITDIVRPNLFSGAGTVADKFAQDLQPAAIQEFIENTVLNSRFGTTAGADAGIIAHAHSHATELFIRSNTDSQGLTRLFTHPELAGAAKNEKFYFRVSTDGWKTSKDLEAKTVSTRAGEYFKIVLRNEHFPVTWERVALSPFIRTEAGETRWLASDFTIRGPPLVFNERLGLPASFERRPGALRDRYNRPISYLTEDLDNKSIVYTPKYFKDLFQKFSDPMEEISADALAEFKFHQKDFVELYVKNSAFRKYVDQLASDENSLSSFVALKNLKSALPTSGCAGVLRSFFSKVIN
ncbi:MAG TPA: hypothetical protein DCS07_04445 [Bdellovibrionales bacterium]|nr:hypothetical protein [Bdellovibrionales bacterium]